MGYSLFVRLRVYHLGCEVEGFDTATTSSFKLPCIQWRPHTSRIQRKPHTSYSVDIYDGRHTLLIFNEDLHPSSLQRSCQKLFVESIVDCRSGLESESGFSVYGLGFKL